MNTRQQLFVLEYRKDLNATQAAIRAGYAKKGAEVTGSKLLRNPKVAAAVEKATARQLESAELSAVRVLEEMRRLGFSNVQDLFDANGDMIPIHKLTREQAACISSIEVVMKNATAGDGKIDRVLKFRMWDKRATLEMLGKHFALLTERVQIEGAEKLTAVLLASRQRAAKAKL